MSDLKDKKETEVVPTDKTVEERRIEAQKKAGRGIGGSKKGSISKKA